MNRQNRVSAACRWGVCVFAVVVVASLCLGAWVLPDQPAKVEDGDSFIYPKYEPQPWGLVLVAATVFGALGGACGALWRWTQPE